MIRALHHIFIVFMGLIIDSREPGHHRETALAGEGKAHEEFVLYNFYNHGEL